MSHNGNEYLLIIGQKQIFKQLISSSYGLYQTTIRPLESHAVMNQKFNDPKSFLLWHELLGHLRLSMMYGIVQNSNGHPLTSRQILKSHDFSCTACSQGKLIIRPYFTKIASESPAFLERIQGDICGPIHPSNRWSHVCLISTRNVAFSRLLAQIIRL